MAKAKETTDPRIMQESRLNRFTEPPPAAASVVGISKNFGKTSVLRKHQFRCRRRRSARVARRFGQWQDDDSANHRRTGEPYTGKVILHGKDVTDLPARERGVGVIFQSYALFPKMTVEKNIGYGLRIRKRKRKEIREDSQRTAGAGPTRRASQEVSVTTLRRSATTRRDCPNTRLQTRSVAV